MKPNKMQLAKSKQRLQEFKKDKEREFISKRELIFISLNPIDGEHQVFEYGHFRPATESDMILFRERFGMTVLNRDTR